MTLQIQIKKIFSYFLLSLTLCITEISAMNPCKWLCCKQRTEHKRHENTLLKTKIVHSRTEMRNLLYNLINTMPIEIIDIILDYDSYKFLQKCKLTVTPSSQITCVAPLYDDTIIASEINGTMKTFNTQNGEEFKRYELQDYKGSFRQLTPLPNNKLATLYNNHSVIIINLITGLPEKIIDQRKYNHDIISLVKLNNAQFIVGGIRSNMRIFDLKTLKEITNLDNTSGANCLGLLSDGSLVEGLGEYIHIRHTRTWRQLQTLAAEKNDHFHCFAISPNDLIAAGTDSGSIILWDPVSNSQKKIQLHNGHVPIYSIAFLVDNSLAAGDLNGLIHFINPDTGTCTSFNKYATTVLWLITLPCGWLVSGSINGIDIWQ